MPGTDEGRDPNTLVLPPIVHASSHSAPHATLRRPLDVSRDTSARGQGSAHLGATRRMHGSEPRLAARACMHAFMFVCALTSLQQPGHTTCLPSLPCARPARCLTAMMSCRRAMTQSGRIRGTWHRGRCPISATPPCCHGAHPYPSLCQWRSCNNNKKHHHHNNHHHNHHHNRRRGSHQPHNVSRRAMPWTKHPPVSWHAAHLWPRHTSRSWTWPVCGHVLVLCLYDVCYGVAVCCHVMRGDVCMPLCDAPEQGWTASRPRPGRCSSPPPSASPPKTARPCPRCVSCDVM